MDMEYEYRLSELTREYNKKDKKLNRRLNLYIIVLPCLAFSAYYFFRGMYWYFPFFFVLLALCALIIFLIVRFIRDKRKFKEEASAYEKECTLLQREANKNGVKIASSFQGSGGFSIISVSVCVIIFLFAAVFVLEFKSFSIDKWLKYESLRPFMIDDFSLYQRSVSYDETSGNKEKYPDLFRSYTREELTEMFSSDRQNNPSEDIVITYSDDYRGDYKGYEEYIDVFYSFTDIFGQDYWVVFIYNRGKDGVYRTSFAEVLPSGSEVRFSNGCRDINNNNIFMKYF